MTTYGTLDDIDQYLKIMALVSEQNAPGIPDGWEYRSYHSLILARGLPCTPATLPVGVVQGDPTLNYQNALELALATPGLRYVEGFATGESVVLEHAWCVDEDMWAVDPTWAEPENRSYFGVYYDPTEVLAAVEEQGFYGLHGNDHLRGFPLLRTGVLFPDETP